MALQADILCKTPVDRANPRREGPFVPFGGDSQQGLVDRMVATLTAIMDKPNHQCVLAVSHGASCANFWCA